MDVDGDEIKTNDLGDGGSQQTHNITDNGGEKESSTDLEDDSIPTNVRTELLANLTEIFQRTSSIVKPQKTDDVHNLFTGSDEEQSPSSDVACEGVDAAGENQEEGEPPESEHQCQGSNMITENNDNEAEDSSQLEDENKSDLKDSSSLDQAFKVVVSNLPPGYVQADLMDLFQYYGKVVECELFAKNSAFVYMESEECALEAVEGLHGVEIRTRRINVEKCGNPQANLHQMQMANSNLEVEVGTFKIYMGSLPESVTKDLISGLLEPYGRIVEMEIHRGNSAFVHMETEDGGRKAMKELHGKTLPGTEKRIVVLESKNPLKPTLPVMKLKVTNIPTTVAASTVRSLFTPYGLVLKVKINTESTECNSAIVHLEQFGNIRSAIKNLSGSIVDGGTIHVEPFFEEEVVEPEPVSVSAVPKQKKRLNSYMPQTQKTPRMPNFNQPFKKVPRNFDAPFNCPRPILRQPFRPPTQPVRRLIPMPSRVELERYPTSRHGRVLIEPPPLMGQSLPNPGFPSRGFDSRNSFSNQLANYDEQWTDSNQEFEEQDDSQHDYDNYDNSSPMDGYSHNYTFLTKIPRNTGDTWQNQGNYSQSFAQDDSFDHLNNDRNDLFPHFPSPEKFPIARPAAPPSLMSVQVPNSGEQDWSTDLSVSNFSQFPNTQDFTSDEPVTSFMNAIPFDYTQINKKPKVYIHNNPQYTPRNATPKTFFNNKGNRGGNKKKKTRHPGLGTTQQLKKTASVTGNAEDFCANQPGTLIPPLMGHVETLTNASPAPHYFQQSWSFSKAKPQDRKPTAKQMKESEEEQKRQYADYLKQKPWLTTQIPGTIRRVEK